MLVKALFILAVTLTTAEEVLRIYEVRGGRPEYSGFYIQDGADTIFRRLIQNAYPDPSYKFLWLDGTTWKIGERNESNPYYAESKTKDSPPTEGWKSKGAVWGINDHYDIEVVELPSLMSESIKDTELSDGSYMVDGGLICRDRLDY